MLEIKIEGGELYDDNTWEFIQIKPQILKLEHSLLSVSKWESKWHKALLEDEKTNEETLDYIRCMTINQVDPMVYFFLSEDNIKEIQDYVNNPMTASTITDRSPGGKPRRRITSELIYYWMVALQIPFECEKWHLNRLLTLINITYIMNKPEKENRMSPGETFERMKIMNEANRKKYKLHG